MIKKSSFLRDALNFKSNDCLNIKLDSISFDLAFVVYWKSPFFRVGSGPSIYPTARVNLLTTYCIALLACPACSALPFGFGRVDRVPFNYCNLKTRVSLSHCIVVNSPRRLRVVCCPATACALSREKDFAQCICWSFIHSFIRTNERTNEHLL